MRRREVIILIIALIALFIPSSLLWYRGHYSMTLARPFTAGVTSSAQRVLIATQGSRFKDALVAGLVRHLLSRSVYVSVIDVSGLPGVKASEWTAIVLIHTWEYSRPQADARAFLDRLAERQRVVVVTTSGSGKEAMPGVDAISAASVMGDPPAPLAAVTGRIDALLDAAR
jgi:hypothetical protein